MAFRRPDGFNADRCIQGTNDDASVSKMSCVSLNYFDDEFIHLFVRRRTRRPPMINRGYFARVQAIRQAVGAFIEGTSGEDGGSTGQIISLGSGWDTTFFRLKASERSPRRYIEVDHREVTCSKCRSIKKNEALSALLGRNGEAEIDVEAGTISSDDYALLPSDLRDERALTDALERGGADHSAPTFVLLECVLAYLDKDATRSLIALLSRLFESCCVLVYDMIGPDDPFGQQLIFNVESRGCPLPGIRSFPTTRSHSELLEGSGFAEAGVHSMLDVYARYVSPDERKRAERIEFMDELEEWHLIMSHYCLAYAYKGDKALFASQRMPLKM